MNKCESAYSCIELEFTQGLLLFWLPSFFENPLFLSHDLFGSFNAPNGALESCEIYL